MKPYSIEEERGRILEAIPVEEAFERTALSLCEYFGKQPDEGVLSDISTFVNMDMVTTSEPMDAYLLFDLDLFIDLIVLHEKICVLQPFDNRYPDMADFEWLEKSSIAKALHKRGILVFRPIVGYDAPSWHSTKEFFRSGKLSKALGPFLAAGESQGETLGELESQTWGIGRHMHHYNEYYAKLYSRWIYDRMLANKSPHEEIRKYWKQFALLVYRTNECLTYARKNSLPYHPSSIKVPVTKVILELNSIRLRTLIDYLVRQVDIRESSKAQRLNKMMGTEHYEIQTPSLLTIVLQQTKHPSDILDVTLDLRKSAAKFRRYISQTTSKKRGPAYEELRKIRSFSLAQSKTTDSLLLELVPEEILQPLLEDAVLGFEIGSNLILSKSLLKAALKYLNIHLFNRSLLFMRKLGKASAATNEIGKQASKVFGNAISREELTRFWNMRNALVEN